MVSQVEPIVGSVMIAFHPNTVEPGHTSLPEHRYITLQGGRVAPGAIEACRHEGELKTGAFRITRSAKKGYVELLVRTLLVRIIKIANDFLNEVKLLGSYTVGGNAGGKFI